MRGIVALLGSVLLGLSGCVAATAGRGSAADLGPVASWPAAEQALEATSAAMSRLQSLREHYTSRTYRGEQLAQFMDSERVYVAPDRKWEHGRYGTPQETIEAEIVQIGTKFFRRIGTQRTWQRMEWPGGVSWPGDEFRFRGASQVAWVGPGEVGGHPARILGFQHAGTAEQYNAGWAFQTQLWLDPQTQYILQRVTTGWREGDSASPPQRFEGTWTYSDHNAALTVNEPAAGPTP
ncbi:MAG TPA: hypothetical protein VKZ60_11755 [Chloroflexota bacterium]|nr:hypothetical protein [Chloroflexota bacterium]